MKKNPKQTLITWSLALGLSLAPAWIPASPVPVDVKEADGIAYLVRGGEPYFIQGVGGSHDLERLAAIGGNSIRTWGAEDKGILDEAHRLGLTVCAGIWIEHERHGFDYGDEAAVAEQIRRHKATVDRFKDHPAILIWGIGNEVELESSDARVWDVVEAVAAYIKEVDPHRPTMTVTAHVEEAVVEEILKRCPSIDNLGSNRYGGIGILAEAIEEAG
ncbi:MAG TPA: glycoside hydrolase family 2 TIM barrel-domain containing protein, partial [Oceanipulchritudo sp.]|nr:glycoside hydrolase family 2 TIM barrel-domain containing protein [Oceanipulchritudo sp.]